MYWITPLGDAAFGNSREPSRVDVIRNFFRPRISRRASLPRADTSDISDSNLPGDLITCGRCQSEYVLEADAFDCPDDPNVLAVHNAIPSCPTCREAGARKMGIIFQ